MTADKVPATGMSLLDRSTYYKGLLVLMGKDRIVDPREREFLIQVGKMLDFDKRFCEAAIDDLLQNVYITGNPVLFSTRQIAECFLSDAVRLALVDEEMHRLESIWLNDVARENGIPEEWLDREVQRRRENKEPLDLSAPFAVQKCLG